MLQFTLDDGTEYTFDQDKLPLAEAIAVKKTAGITVKEFLAGVSTGDPVALKAMVWLARLRAGEGTRYDDVEFDVLAFFESVRHIDEADNDDEAVQGEVPTLPEPPTNGSDTGTTPPDDEPTT